MDDEPSYPDPDRCPHLLPEGCRDLLDWILRQEEAGRQETKEEGGASPLFICQEIVFPMPGAPRRFTKQKRTLPLPARVRLSQPVQVGTLAARLGLKPYHLIEVLIARKIFANMEGWLNFATAAAICAELGVVAERDDFDISVL